MSIYSTNWQVLRNTVGALLLSVQELPTIQSGYQDSDNINIFLKCGQDLGDFLKPSTITMGPIHFSVEIFDCASCKTALSLMRRRGYSETWGRRCIKIGTRPSYIQSINTNELNLEVRVIVPRA